MCCCTYVVQTGINYCTTHSVFAPPTKKALPLNKSPIIHRVCLRVWDLRPTSPHCRLSLWESAVTSWPRLSPALWLRGGQLEESLADVGVGSLLCCCCCFLGGSPATSCATSPPKHIIIVVSEDKEELDLQWRIALTDYLQDVLDSSGTMG